ncbi:MAG: helix-turn-helix domain-containing protein [Candidatus Accumulibacter sp.]|jgi:cytoskeleton protein RodZ|nr:helix-turn-helix domain-containing protein [Accumulibacter sp.]
MSEEKAVPDSAIVPDSPIIPDSAINPDSPIVPDPAIVPDSMRVPELAMVPELGALPEQDEREPVLADDDDAIDVGQRLRLAREARGISVGETAKALKLSPRQVEAMEANDWFQWPRTVTRGFVRNYARYIEIDAGPLMAALDQVPMPHGPELAVGAAPSVNMPREGQGDRRRDYVWVVAGLVTLLLALLAYFFIPAETWRSSLESIKALVSENEALPDAVEPPGVIVVSGVVGEASDTVPIPVQAAPEAAFAAPPGEPSPSAAPAEPAPSGPSPAPPALIEPPSAQSSPAEPAPSGPGAESSPAGSVLAFSFAERSWVEVRDGGGQVIFSQLNPAGSQREIVGQPPFALVIGNASHVTLKYRGQPVDLSPRSRDDVARLTLE